MIGRELTARALQVSRSFVTAHFCETIKSNATGRQAESEPLRREAQLPPVFSRVEKTFDAIGAVSGYGRLAEPFEVVLQQPFVQVP